LAELRRHPISNDWVVVCPEKALGQVIESDGQCAYCPGNESLAGKEIYRIYGKGDPGGSGWSVRVVAGSPPLFHIEGRFAKEAAGICDRMEAIGAHEIIVESPSHCTEFEDLDDDQAFAVLDVIRARLKDLANDTRLGQVLVFKSRDFGVDSPASHPRWHIVSTPFVPTAIKEKLAGSRRYFAYKERCVFCDYILQERRSKTRVIVEEPTIIAMSPYAARAPFEVWILPLKHSADFQTISQDETWHLGKVLKRLLSSLRKLHQASGYVISVYTAPYRRPKPGAWETIESDFHWHIEIRPSVNILNGLKQDGRLHLNPVPPEEAARVLTELL
jgi:UDPglucose--hexose-1-phosphate uridylyltransferase